MKTSRKVRVVIIENQEVIRIGLRTALEKNDHIAIVAEGETEPDALSLARKHEPDVLLLGLNSFTGRRPSKGILAACDTIRCLIETGTRVLVLSRNGQKGLIHAVMHAGAVGFLLKDEAMNSSAELAQLILHAAQKGRLPLSQTFYQKLYPHGLPLEIESIPKLSARRIEIMQTIADNPHLTLTQVADLLGIAESTLRNNLSAISRALDTPGLNGAMIECLRLGVVQIGR